MCDDGGQHSHMHAAPGPAALGPSGLSRRRLLLGMVSLAGLAGLSAGLAACTSGSSGAVALGSRAPHRAGLNAYILGMHLHASASEGAGSMRSQLAEAAATGFDVAWFSEHDWRRDRLLFRPSFSFDPDEVVMGAAGAFPPDPPPGRQPATAAATSCPTPSARRTPRPARSRCACT